MNLDEGWTTIKARVAHPVLGPYFLSLMFLNWKLWIYFFSGEETAETRIRYVEDYLLSPEARCTLVYSLIPLIFYLYILPWVVILLKWGQNKIALKELRQELRHKKNVEDEKSLGGELDLLAASMRAALNTLNQELVEHVQFMQNFQGSDLQHLKSLRESADRMSKVIQENAAYMNMLNGAFRGIQLEQKSHLQIAREFQQRRSK